jgi:hypothetical protein
MAMNTHKLARVFLLALLSLAFLAAFAILDWYPTVKELGRLRREQSDLERKIKAHTDMAANFVFPDAGERSLFVQSGARVFQSLPKVEVDAAWLELACSDLQNRAKGIIHLMVFGEAETLGPGPSGLSGWLKLQEREIHRSLRAADVWMRYPWHGVFLSESAGKGKPSSRPLGIALDAPLSELLDFINHISWGAVRLEIIRLRLEPVGKSSRAWLVCRGDYFCLAPSAWTVLPEAGNGTGLLVDPDSPLLLQRIDPLLAPGVVKKELPPAGSPW